MGERYPSANEFFTRYTGGDKGRDEEEDTEEDDWNPWGENIDTKNLKLEDYYYEDFPFFNDFMLTPFVHKKTGSQLLKLSYKDSTGKILDSYFIKCMYPVILRDSERRFDPDSEEDNEEDDADNDEQDHVNNHKNDDADNKDSEFFPMLQGVSAAEYDISEVTPQERFLAVKSWAAMISEFEWRSFYINNGIDECLFLEESLMIPLLKFIVKHNAQFIFNYVNAICEICTFEGHYYAPSLIINIKHINRVLKTLQPLEQINFLQFIAAKNLPKDVYFETLKEFFPPDFFYPIINKLPVQEVIAVNDLWREYPDFEVVKLEREAKKWDLTLLLELHNVHQKVLYVENNHITLIYMPSGHCASIKNIPESLCKLTKLRTLSMESHYFASLPSNFGMLSSLEYLYLSHNNLTELPASFMNLRSLLRVDLSSNKFTQFPNVICELQNIDHVSLYNNKLNDYPDSMWHLRKLIDLDLGLPAERVPQFIRDQLMKGSRNTELHAWYPYPERRLIFISTEKVKKAHPLRVHIKDEELDDRLRYESNLNHKFIVMNNARTKKMIALGFQMWSETSPNFTKEYSIDTAEGLQCLFDELSHIITKVYNIPGNEFFYYVGY